MHAQVADCMHVYKYTGVVFSHREVHMVVDLVAVTMGVYWYILSIKIHHKSAATHSTSFKDLMVLLKYSSGCSNRVLEWLFY